jgi:hypothetical protein
LVVGIAYGLLLSLMLGGIELFIMEGPMLVWLSGLSFTTNLIIRSAIYAAIIMILQWLQVGEAIAGLPRATSSKTFLSGFIYSALISVLFNLVLGIANLIGSSPGVITRRSRKTVSYFSLISRDRRGWPSNWAELAFTGHLNAVCVRVGHYA